MMAARSDSSLPPPKRKLATYGKGARKQAPSGSIFSLDKEPLIMPPAAPRPVAKSSGVTDDKPTRPVTKTENKPKQYGRKDLVRPQQPKPTISSNQVSRTVSFEENGRAKKAKLSTSDSTAYDNIWDPPAGSSPSPPRAHSTKPIAGPSRVVRPQPTPSAAQIPKVEDTVMNDIYDPMPFSPATVKTLNTLSVNKRKEEPVRRQIPFRPTREERAEPRPISLKDRAGIIKREPERKASPRQRRRLIDALAAQAEDESEPDEPSQATQSTPEPSFPGLGESSSPASTLPDQPRARVLMRQESAVKKKAGPKFTYGSQQRTMLLDTSGDPGADDLLLNEPLIPTATITPLVPMDEDDEPSSTSAMRSIHELRQAGANNRFADEMDDVLDRVGKPTAKPTSSRRNALFELAQKLQDKNFQRQFRNHGGDDTLLDGVRKENDIVAGYALTSIVATLLSASSSSHLLKLLETSGFLVALGNLLPVSLDISMIARDRKSNLSRNGQQSLLSIKAAVVSLPIWQPYSPSTLSPRTLAMKSLHLILQQSGGAAVDSGLYSAELTEQLFSVLSAASNPEGWDPEQPQSTLDLFLALSILEVYSVDAMQTAVGAEWTDRYLPIVCDVLDACLRHEAKHAAEIDVLALKMALNIANNNPDAPPFFVQKGILGHLAQRVFATFKGAMEAVSEPEKFSTIYQSLVLILGVMINVFEHDPTAGNILQVSLDSGDSPLDKLIKLFLDHRDATAEVCHTHP